MAQSPFELLVEIEMPNYIRSYVAAKNVRPKYFEKGKHILPLKYCNKLIYKTQELREPDGVNYMWDVFPSLQNKKHKIIKHFLINIATGERVVRNEKKVGKVREVVINGQRILSGNIKTFEKDKLLNEIKNFARPYVKTIKPIERFPLVLRLKVYDTPTELEFGSNQEWDLENRMLPYGKAIHDLLVDEGIIPDDNAYYITGPMQPMLYPIENYSKKKLILSIYKDNRPEILENFDYQYKLGDKIK